MVIPLDLLKAGEWGEVHDVRGETSWVHRLAELGVRSGSRLHVVRSGSPCLIQVGESKLSIRDEWRTSEITVRLIHEPVA